MIKCEYSACKKELNENNIKNFIFDSAVENYSGFYCSDEHAIIDMVKSMFTDSTKIVNKVITDLKLTNVQPYNAQQQLGEQAAPAPAVTATGPGTNPFGQQPAQEIEQPEAADDLDLDVITDVNQNIQEGNPLVAVNVQDNATKQAEVKAAGQKLNDSMAGLVASIIDKSKKTNYALGVNYVPDTFIHEGVVVPRTTYSLYSISPSLSFNITYGMDFISFVFADSQYTFQVNELEKIFAEQDKVSQSLVDRIVFIIEDVHDIQSDKKEDTAKPAVVAKDSLSSDATATAPSAPAESDNL